MINIHSINCSLAFAPYLAESARAYLDEEISVSKVIRQGGSGLIIRSGEDLLVRYRNREAVLQSCAARHYLRTITFRSERFDIARLSDEVVLASAQGGLLLSHPQSEFWLDAGTVSHLIEAAGGATEIDLPEWIRASAGGGRLLLSDQRNGRWVLLGEDHISEFERRAERLNRSSSQMPAPRSPRIAIKGVTIRLQSAFSFVRALESFAETADFEPFEHQGPDFFLRAARATEGMALMDSDARAAITAREARKWAAIIQSEIERLHAHEIERNSIHTVFAEAERGRWVLQWGDEIFIDEPTLARLRSGETEFEGSSLASRVEDGYILLLDQRTGSCVALDHIETDFGVR
ncbi:MAG: hypothetical protein AB1631_27535 [Acidobacteriota bacterium]